MTVSTIERLIDLIPSVVAAIASIYAVRKVQQVHVIINSKFDQWRAKTKIASFAEGVLEGKKKEG